MTGRRLRVALVTPRFPPDTGGLEQYVGWLARMLHDSSRHEVVVVTTTAGRRPRTDTWHGVTVHRLATWATVSNTPVNPGWWWQVDRLLRQLDVDVVNAHAPVPGLADIAALRSSTPVVLTYHAGSMVKGGNWVDPLLRTYERRVLRRLFDSCAATVAVSPVSLAYGTGKGHLYHLVSTRRSSDPRLPARRASRRGCSTPDAWSAPPGGRACTCCSRRFPLFDAKCPTYG